jgi:uncharacterized protein
MAMCSVHHEIKIRAILGDMANIESHAPGSFCWIELGTTDQQSAKSFYFRVLGWQVTDFPMGPGEAYSMFQLQGRDMAGGYTLRKDQREQGVPPHWMLYIAVENADGTAARVIKAGGTVIMPPFEVMDLGRMAVLQDPTGAVFSIWQARKHSGIGAGGENTLCWADLDTNDPERAARFYAEVFGWQISKADKDSSGYLHIRNGEHFIGGIPPSDRAGAGMPPHWMLYFAVADVAGGVANVTQGGGKVMMPATAMPNVGTIAVVSDPQGAVFALFKSART